MQVVRHDDAFEAPTLERPGIALEVRFDDVDVVVCREIREAAHVFVHGDDPTPEPSQKPRVASPARRDVEQLRERLWEVLESEGKSLAAMNASVVSGSWNCVSLS